MNKFPDPLILKKGFVANMNCDIKIYSPCEISTHTLLQLSQISTLPGVHSVFGLPDIHSGYGFPIGSVSAFTNEGIISPNGVGYDINCGVSSVALNICKQDLSPEIAEDLYNAIPSGMNIKSGVIDFIGSIEINKVLDNGLDYLNTFYNTQNAFVENNGRMDGNSRLVCQKGKARGNAQLGSIGSGNHYLEIQYVDKIYDKERANLMGIYKENQLLVTVHSGSRGLGKFVCSDYIQKIQKAVGEDCGVFKSLLNRSNVEINRDCMTNYDENVYKSFVPSIYNRNTKMEESVYDGNLEKDEDIVYANITSKIGQSYYTAMCSAANYAFCNRSLISHIATETIKKKVPSLQTNLIYDVCHNIASKEVHFGHELTIHRKGASRALGPSLTLPEKYQNMGQPVLVGGSMGTSSYILVGNNQILNSSCHGAGRMVQRKDSHSLFTFENVKQKLNEEGITIKYGSERGVIEEAPGCYKDVDIIADYCDETEISKKVVRVKPYIVIKG